MAPSSHRLRKHCERVGRMLADPECVDGTLALGLALARWADFGEYAGEPGKGASAEAICVAAFGENGRWVMDRVLRADIRRYDAAHDPEAGVSWATRCGAPMIRRQGPCGQAAGRKALLTDPDTGRQQWIAGCSRHSDWFDAKVAANRAEAVDATGPANTGGVLARHLPEIDWNRMYRSLDKAWEPPREGDDTPPARPVLRLIHGSAATDDASGTGRP